MERETKLQEMQRRLNLKGMDSDEKKDLKEKLAKAGGRVVDLEAPKAEEPKKTGEILRPRREPPRPRPEPARAKPLAPPKKEPEMQPMPQAKLPSPFAVIGHRMNCFLSWIFDFSGRRFRQRYLRLLLQDYQNALILFNSTLAPLYAGNIQALEFRKNLYLSKNLLEYELGYHFWKLFNGGYFSTLQKQAPRGVEAAREPLKLLFKDLYRLRAHATHSRVAIPMLLRKYAQMFPKKAARDVSFSRLNKAMATIWEQFFMETNSVMVYYWIQHCRTLRVASSLDAFIGTVDPPVGALASEIEALLESQELENTIPEESEGGQTEQTMEEEAANLSFPTEEIRQGVDFIFSNINFAKMNDKYKNASDLRALFTLEDKLFYTYAIVDYFDGEFSFLWGGSYINFYVMSSVSGYRYDPKKELLLLNGRLNHFYEQTNEYLRQLRAYNELIKLRGIGSQRLLQTDTKEKDLAHLSLTARNTLIKILEEYGEHLKKILDSKDSPDSVVGNWDEKLVLTNSMGRHLADMTVTDALKYAYNLVESSRWLLTQSDLSGPGVRLIRPLLINAELYRSEPKSKK